MSLALVSGAPGTKQRLGAIDVGSNSIRLLVAEYDQAAGLTVIDEVKDQPRLAQGLATTGRLDPAAIERALEALHRMREVCQRRGVTKIAAVATSAVREAANGREFVRLVREQLDIPLKIIDGNKEAELSFRSVAHHFRLDAARTVIADIGGGSLELIAAVKGLVEQKVSLPLGAVRLTETDIAERKDPRKAVAELRSRIRKLFRKELSLRQWQAGTVIGSGGSFTNLGRMVVARRGVPASDSVHGVSVTVSEIEQLLEWLETMSPERRRQVDGLSPERADIILAGLAVTVELLERVDAREVIVSAFGLREGLLLEMVGKEVAEPHKQDPLLLAREFVERCQGDRRHVEQVRRLALLLFDQIGDRMGCGPDERRLLEYAGLLHDVGQLVSYRQHHKHSLQLILNADRLNFSARDRLLVALISRYHRKKGPSKKHELFAQLSEEDQEIVRRVSGLLRLADGLDRGHTAVVETVRTRLTDQKLTVTVAPRLAGSDCSLEVWGAERKADVLAKVLGREVVVRAG
ncbi:MAG TPA: Ppx/GppA phosphatase family protein [Gemmatimonadales bacterium]|nr:Ppx/GppA phosphatase family protein [Gemmatimonadales bacterium]